MISEPSDLDIGATLAEGRKRTGRSLEEAAEQTRIRKIYLESLEANRFEDLPGRAYVVGFLKVYARYLAVDAEPLLAAYNAISVVETAAPQSIKLRPLPGKTTRAIRSGRGLFLLGFSVFLLIGLGVYFLPVWFAPSTPVLPPETVVLTQERFAAEQVVQEDSPVLPVITDPVAPGAESAPLEGAPSEGSPAIDAVTEMSEPVLPDVAQNGSSLRMLAIGRGELMIKVDGRPSQRYALREGLDLTWPVKDEVTAELGAPGLVRFWLDQVELVLGERTSFQLRKAKEN